MKDEIIKKMAEAATSVLSCRMGPFPADNLIPSYNYLIEAAQQNHPENMFISKLPPIEKSVICPELAVLYAQLGIAIESAQESAE